MHSRIPVVPRAQTGRATMTAHRVSAQVLWNETLGLAGVKLAQGRTGLL